MLRPWMWTLGLTACLMTAGCVERRFVITSSAPGLPPDKDAGAVVYDEKGMPISGTPADKQFTYYGTYRFTVMRDGYQTQIIEENVKAPWYEWFLLDFISENLVPWNIRDIRRIHVEMQPLPMFSAEAVLQEAEQLRQRGQGIGGAQPDQPSRGPLAGPASSPSLPRQEAPPPPLPTPQ